MKNLKFKIQLTMFVLFLSLTNTTFAKELTKNENQYNGVSHIISNANTDGHSGSNSESTPAVTPIDQKIVNTEQQYQNIEERRRQLQQAQLEAYKRYLQQRSQQTANNPNISDDLKARQQEYLKNMEARQELIFKMMEQHRKDAEKRRFKNQHQMYKTDTGNNKVSTRLNV